MTNTLINAMLLTAAGNAAKLAAQYRSLSIILITAATVCFLIAVILWFVLSIPQQISVLTRLGSKKEIKKLQSRGSAGKVYSSRERTGAFKPMLNWGNTAEQRQSVENVHIPREEDVTQPINIGHSNMEDECPATIPLSALGSSFVIESVNTSIGATDKEVT